MKSLKCGWFFVLLRESPPADCYHMFTSIQRESRSFSTFLCYFLGNAVFIVSSYPHNNCAQVFSLIVISSEVLFLSLCRLLQISFRCLGGFFGYTRCCGVLHFIRNYSEITGIRYYSLQAVRTAVFTTTITSIERAEESERRVQSPIQWVAVQSPKYNFIIHSDGLVMCVCVFNTPYTLRYGFLGWCWEEYFVHSMWMRRRSINQTKKSYSQDGLIGKSH